MERDYFTFKKAWRDALSGLPLQVRAEVSMAVIEYGIMGVTSELKARAEAAFSLIKADIDRDMQEQDRKRQLSEVRRQAAEKRWGKNPHDGGLHVQNSDLHVQNSDLHVQNEPSHAHEEAYSQDNLSLPSLTEHQEEEKESSAKKETKIDPQSFIDYFNAEMQKADALIPHHTSLTPKRQAAILARCKEYGRAAMGVMVRKAAASAFLNGGGDKAFVASIDWLLRPNNFPKVIEGNFDNIKQNEHGTDRANNQTPAERRDEEFAKYLARKLSRNGVR